MVCVWTWIGVSFPYFLTIMLNNHGLDSEHCFVPVFKSEKGYDRIEIIILIKDYLYVWARKMISGRGHSPSSYL